MDSQRRCYMDLAEVSTVISQQRAPAIRGSSTRADRFAKAIALTWPRRGCNVAELRTCSVVSHSCCLLLDMLDGWQPLLGMFDHLQEHNTVENCCASSVLAQQWRRGHVAKHWRDPDCLADSTWIFCKPARCLDENRDTTLNTCLCGPHRSRTSIAARFSSWQLPHLLSKHHVFHNGIRTK